LSVCHKRTNHMSIDKKLIHIEQELNKRLPQSQRIALQKRYLELQVKQMYQKRPQIKVVFFGTIYRWFLILTNKSKP
jgi:hypothetical protein